MTKEGKEVFEKLNKALANAQEWLAASYPQYERAFVQAVRKAQETNSDLYHGIMGILIRIEYEGEKIFKEQLDREYILTEAVREKVMAIIDSSESADARINAWKELKQLLDIK